MNRSKTSPGQGYSADVEIDHDGTVKWARDIEEGAIVAVPMHMVPQIVRQSRERR